MRKIAFLAVTAFVLIAATVAYAAQVNQYTVTGSTQPATKGSTSNPKPIGIKFGFSVGEASNNRPAVVEKYTIKFGGTRVNTAVAAEVLRRTRSTPRAPRAARASRSSAPASSRTRPAPRTTRPTSRSSATLR